MASSRLAGMRAPLLVPDFNAASSPMDQAPLSPPRAALSPTRPASPGLQGLSARPLTLSPSRLVPPPAQLASPRSPSVAHESISAPAPDIQLSLPIKVVSEQTDTPNLDGHGAIMAEATSDTISFETVTGAHILGAAVALLASATEGQPMKDPTQSPPVAHSADAAPENTGAKETAVCSESASVSQDENERPSAPHNEAQAVDEMSDAVPWWLSANGGSEGSGEQTSWWSQQVEAARAKEQEQEAQALQESLHKHKGPDAPYALSGADTLLGAAAPSLGEPNGGGAWWNQLIKVPTEDWLYLRQEEQTQIKEEERQAAGLEEKPGGEQSKPVLVEGREQAKESEAPAIEADSKGLDSGDNVSVDVIAKTEASPVEVVIAEEPLVEGREQSKGSEAPAKDGPGLTTNTLEESVAADVFAKTEAPALDVLTIEQPLVGEVKSDLEAEREGAAVAFADTLVEGAFDGPPANPLVISIPTAEDGSDASLITSAILLAAEGVILDSAIAPTDLQLDPPAPEQQTVELNSPVETQIVAPLPAAVEMSPSITDKLSTDVPLIVAPVVTAPLAPAQPAAVIIEPTPVVIPGVATDIQIGVDPGEAALPVGLPSPKSAVTAAQARLEAIKAMRSNRLQAPMLAAAVALAPPSPSGLPSLSLVSGVFPSRGGSPRVASSNKIDASIWKTLQDMEWATESTTDTFGRSSVAAHLAERHDEKHG